MGPLSGLDQIFWFLLLPGETNQDGLLWTGRFSAILGFTSGEKKVHLSLSPRWALRWARWCYMMGQALELVILLRAESLAGSYLFRKEVCSVQK